MTNEELLQLIDDLVVVSQNAVYASINRQGDEAFRRSLYDRKHQLRMDIEQALIRISA